MYSRILVPLDGSELAEGALSHAVEVAKRFESTIVLIQVVGAANLAVAADPLTGTAADIATTTEVLDAYQQSAREYLSDAAQRISAAGVQVEWQVGAGSAVQEIARAAREGSAEMIVMSTHGRSGLGRLVFGSVADGVLQECQVPILLIRPEPES